MIKKPVNGQEGLSDKDEELEPHVKILVMIVNVIEQYVDKVLNAELIGLEGDELVEPEPVEENKKETMEVVSNLRNRETYYKPRANHLRTT